MAVSEKEYDISELQQKAESYCARAEHCASEVAKKLSLWGASPLTAKKIIEQLYEEDYLNDERYCRAYVHDKYKLNKWGQRKIGLSLRMKGLPSDCIDDALEEIDEEEYNDTLMQLLLKKMRTTKASSIYVLREKLIRFALGRGYDMNEIIECLDINSEELNDYLEEH